MIVVDASVVLEILLGTALGRRFEGELYERSGSWNVPHRELRHNLTAYDATYLALAEALGATLVSGDRGFDRVPGRRAAVEVWR